MSGVLVVMEQGSRMSWEALAAGQKLAQGLGTSLDAATFGPYEGLGQKKVDNAYVIEHALLKAYTPDGFTLALSQLIEAKRPDYVLFPHTYQVRDFGPKLATRFAQVLVGDAVDVRVEDGGVTVVR